MKKRLRLSEGSGKIADSAGPGVAVGAARLLSLSPPCSRSLGGTGNTPSMQAKDLKQRATAICYGSGRRRIRVGEPQFVVQTVSCADNCAASAGSGWSNAWRGRTATT